jgi:hypothetical protein
MPGAFAIVAVLLKCAELGRHFTYPRALDFSGRKSYDSSNVEVREFTFNRCPFQ